LPLGLANRSRRSGSSGLETRLENRRRFDDHSSQAASV
jgi:hypothetical protein